MADSTKLNAAKNLLSQYSKDLPLEIKKQIDNAWTPILQKAAEKTGNLKADFLPKYFSSAMTGPGMGTSEADLSPTQKLTSMGRTLGDFSSQIGQSQALSDYLGGQSKDLYQMAIDSMKFGQGTAQQGYQNEFGEYQLAIQQEEAARARAAAARAAAAAASNQQRILDAFKHTPGQTAPKGEDAGTSGLITGYQGAAPMSPNPYQSTKPLQPSQYQSVAPKLPKLPITNPMGNTKKYLGFNY